MLSLETYFDAATADDQAHWLVLVDVATQGLRDPDPRVVWQMTKGHAHGGRPRQIVNGAAKTARIGRAHRDILEAYALRYGVSMSEAIRRMIAITRVDPGPAAAAAATNPQGRVLAVSGPTRRELTTTSVVLSEDDVSWILEGRILPPYMRVRRTGHLTSRDRVRDFGVSIRAIVESFADLERPLDVPPPEPKVLPSYDELERRFPIEYRELCLAPHHSRIREAHRALYVRTFAGRPFVLEALSSPLAEIARRALLQKGGE